MATENRKIVQDTPSRLVGIEAGRGIAALLVVLFHATAIMNLPKYFSALPLNGFFQFGYAGVDFFFVLSGFIILFTHFDDIGKKGALRAYGRKRFIRVYPIYWVVCALVIVALALIPSLGGGLPSAAYIVQSLLLTPQQTMPLVIVAWTLTHEIFFYVLFGVVIFRPKLGLLLMGSWFFGIFISAIFGFKWNYLFAFIFNLHNIEFLLGMLIALVCRSYTNFNQTRLITSLGIICFFLTAMLDVYAHPLWPNFCLLSYSISSSLIIFGLAASELSHHFSIPKWLSLLGSSSYSIYLVHFLALSFFIKFFVKFEAERTLSINIIFFILVAAATIGGISFHIFIERPVLRVLGRMTHSHVPQMAHL